MPCSRAAVASSPLEAQEAMSPAPTSTTEAGGGVGGAVGGPSVGVGGSGVGGCGVAVAGGAVGGFGVFLGPRTAAVALAADAPSSPPLEAKAASGSSVTSAKTRSTVATGRKPVRMRRRFGVVTAAVNRSDHDQRALRGISGTGRVLLDMDLQRDDTAAEPPSGPANSNLPLSAGVEPAPPPRLDVWAPPQQAAWVTPAPASAATRAGRLSGFPTLLAAAVISAVFASTGTARSEERRVGKECR